MENLNGRWWGISRHSPLRLVSGTPETQPDDSALVLALSNGEEWAASAIWNRYAPMVYGLLDRALGSAGESDDLTQEVFLRVFAAIKKVRDPKALRSFIYSAAIRMLRWHFRSKRVRRVLTLSASGDLPEQAVRGADSEGRQLLERFYRLLDSLSANDRTAFVLRHIEGLSLDEIVAATGVSLATVKRRVRRGSKQAATLARADAELLQYFPYGAPDGI
ncbi:MAG: RNA polymerase sigma factor [Myxococcota bacterium]|nr:RNA polymerase sigma factor [Myxococcota bacterium]